MSIRAMTAVWQLELPDSQKIVLLALADCANDEGHCWPSMASLTKKCSKSERTIQGVIKELVAAGHLTRKENPGKGCNYYIHPRTDCAPQVSRPAETAPPQGTAQTPAAAADKPSRTINKPREARAREIELPSDWKPSEFGAGTKSRKIIDSWPPGELDVQLEHFTAHHRKKGDKFKDWQAAWATWVLGGRRFRNGSTNFQRSDGASPDRRSSLARAIDEGEQHLDWLSGA